MKRCEHRTKEICRERSDQTCSKSVLVPHNSKRVQAYCWQPPHAALLGLWTYHHLPCMPTQSGSPPVMYVVFYCLEQFSHPPERLIYSVLASLVRWRTDREKSPCISSCSQLWLSVSQDKGTLAGYRNSGTSTSRHVTCDFSLEWMQGPLQRGSCWQTYLYPRL